MPLTMRVLYGSECRGTLPVRSLPDSPACLVLVFSRSDGGPWLARLLWLRLSAQDGHSATLQLVRLSL